MMATPEKLIAAARVRETFGNVSDMTLWRWLASPDLGFPRPVVISRRRYWREAEVAAWIAAQVPAHA